MKIKQEIIINFMVKNCLSVSELGKLSKLHRDTINKIIRDEKVGFKTVAKLANFLNINFKDLIELEKD